TTNLGVILMTIKVHEMPTMVVVADRPPLVDPDTHAMGANLLAEDFDLLPVQRDYRSLPTLLPQANESFQGDGTNFAGATGMENKFFVDGVDTTDPFRGLTGTGLPYNFVREVRIKTGGYEAEFRSSLGGLIEAVTPSGGNELEGRAFGYFLNNRFSAEPRQGSYDPETGDFAEYDVGASLSGPLVRDRLWFYAAYNPTFWREDVKMTGWGFEEDRFTSHRFAAKLNWQADASNNVILSVFGDPTYRRGVGDLFANVGTPTGFANPDPYLLDIETGGINASLRGKHLLGDRFLLKTSLSRVTNNVHYEGSTERGRTEPLFVDLDGVWSGGSPVLEDLASTVWTFEADGTYMLDRHTLKAGLAFKDNRIDAFEIESALYAEPPDSFSAWIFAVDGTVRNRIPSAFLQDSWRIGEKLRLDYGLRWDGQFLVGSDGEVAQKILGQWQPRLGFTYQPGEPGTQKIHGSAGRFYQELSTALSSMVHMGSAVFASNKWSEDPRDGSLDPRDWDWGELSQQGIAPEVDGLKGQHYDEFALGYERQLGGKAKVGVQGVYRALREAVEYAADLEDSTVIYGNPGEGRLSEYPDPSREYLALELSFEYARPGAYSLLASYVISRSYGNYTGLFASDGGPLLPNIPAYSDPYFLSTGWLNNDRTHVLKLSGSYRVGWGLVLGASGSWMSGTPKNELGKQWGNPVLYNGLYDKFLQQRGTAGRTPAIWDLNLRVTYDLLAGREGGLRPRLTLDVFHLGSQRTAVQYDPVHYRDVDASGNQLDPNPYYGEPIRFQPPMAMRLGMEVAF
ncbi:MAG: hypothetical protein JXA90_10410, partial [Planctomycetes bacterium]|nr:hypothetical protein [Planctomycetota bacterium]